ncbi:hypothetical protein OAI06_00680 [Schleiferiaceae bacterium]|nr:hypothetical protein [Schleiferiaceae bacterium]
MSTLSLSNSDEVILESHGQRHSSTSSLGDQNEFKGWGCSSLY